MDIFHHITEIPNPPPPKKCLYSAASCIASPWGSRGKNGACHFIFQSPWWSLVKLLMGNPTVSSWPLYSSAGSEPSQGFAGQERQPMKPEEFPHFDVGPRRKKRLVLNSLLWKCSVVSPLLRLQTCFYLGACVNSEFITFLVKAKHLNCVQPVWPFIVSIYNKKESRLKT